jgi:spore germination protein
MGKSKFYHLSIFILLLMMSIVITTGCWNRREIEDLGLVVGVAFDKPKSMKGKEKEEKESADYKERKEHRMSMTNQFVVPKAMGKKDSGASSSQKAYTNISSEGDTVFQIIRQIATTSSRAAYYKHLKVFIISDNIARTINMQNLLNVFLRDPEVGRDIKMMIAEGNAKKILEVKPIKEDLPAMALLSLMKNEYKTSRMAPEMTLGDMSKKMAVKSSFIMPRVIAYGKNVQMAGAAVIKGKTNTLIGWLGEEETEGVNWLSGKAKGGTVEAVDEKTKEMIVYEIDNIKSKIKPKVEGEKISFDVDIESDGELAEDWIISDDAFKETFINKAEESVKKEILPMIRQGLRKTQNEFKVDVVGFGKKLSIKYPQVWEKVKDNWDEEFSKIPVKINVKINILQFGRKGMKM